MPIRGPGAGSLRWRCNQGHAFDKNASDCWWVNKKNGTDQPRHPLCVFWQPRQRLRNRPAVGGAVALLQPSALPPPLAVSSHTRKQSWAIRAYFDLYWAYWETQKRRLGAGVARLGVLFVSFAQRLAAASLTRPVTVAWRPTLSRAPLLSESVVATRPPHPSLARAEHSRAGGVPI